MSFALPLAQAGASFVSGMSAADGTAREARAARRTGEIEQAALRRKGTAQLGQMRTRFLAAGLAPGGSPDEALDEATQAAELEALKARYHGDLKAAQLRARARQERFKAAASFAFEAGPTLAKLAAPSASGPPQGNRQTR